MSIRLGILPYGVSESCRELKAALNQAFAEVVGVTPRMIKLENSIFRGRPADVIINYGNRSAPAAIFGQANVLNPQSSLNNAANKLTALGLMQNAGVSVIPFTANRAVAQGWVANGDVVYSRATLNGHSGEGIDVHSRDEEGGVPELPRTPLYTKAITGQRREWRVHVFKGVITYVQVKRRANGYQDNSNYREDVRNHHTGWIYATENINPTDAVLRNAVNAVVALGLDFGAVDIISQRSDAYVLEVNTAPGLTGTTLEVFTRNVVEYVNARRGSRPAAYVARFPTPAPLPTPAAPEAPSAVPVGTRGGEVDAMVAHQAARVAVAPQQVTPNVPNAGDVPFGIQEMQVTRSNSNNPREDGYYVANVQALFGGISTKAILWSANGQWFRHGWNHPIASGSVSNISKLSHVVVDGAPAGAQISLAFATQE